MIVPTLIHSVLGSALGFEKMVQDRSLCRLMHKYADFGPQSCLGANDFTVKKYGGLILTCKRIKNQKNFVFIKRNH